MSKKFFYADLAGFLKNYQPKLSLEAEYLNTAVLVPLLETERGTEVLFEVRSEDLLWQPGEICFPGGRLEPGDINAQAAAVRETCEELNLQPEQIEVCGPLDYLATQIGVIVYPYVGRLKNITQIQPSIQEVGEIFSVPLKDLLVMQPTVSQIQMFTKPVSENFPLDSLPEYAKGPRARKVYDVYFYTYENYLIWGLTARILKNFIDLCKEHALA